MEKTSRVVSPPFLRIPAEIRVAIYKLLLTNTRDKTLRVYIESPSEYAKRNNGRRQRQRFRHMADRMRSQSAESTYTVNTREYRDFKELHLGILGVNRQIHAEGSYILYSEHLLDFEVNVASIVPFLQDRTSQSLSSIKHMRIVKSSHPCTKDFDRCEWRRACKFLAESMKSKKMQLIQLDLGVVGGTQWLGGRPVKNWKPSDVLTSHDFSILTNQKDMDEDMDWIQYVSEIKGLQVLNVQSTYADVPIQEPEEKMEFFLNFSASIEKGLAEYLRSVMLVEAS
ncbi:hypothetical protein ACLMJK_003164 [Lecanora helva]